MITSQKIAELLNEVLAADPQAVYFLLCAAAPANQALADHPSIVVHPQGASERWSVSILGLLQGVGVMDGHRIEAVYEAWDNDPEARGEGNAHRRRNRLVGFRAVPMPGCGPRPLDAWHEDDGEALWWKFPVEEAPYVGSPLDTDWPGYHTHWTPIPVPTQPATEEPSAGEAARPPSPPRATDRFEFETLHRIWHVGCPKNAVRSGVCREIEHYRVLPDGSSLKLFECMSCGQQAYTGVDKSRSIKIQPVCGRDNTPPDRALGYTCTRDKGHVGPCAMDLIQPAPSQQETSTRPQAH